MIGKRLVATALLTLFFLSFGGVAWSSFDIQAKEDVTLEVKGYNGLAEVTVFQGKLAAGVRESVTTTYSGLALLLFEQGQQYPVIIGEQPLLLEISSPKIPPSFTGSKENEYFYALLGDAQTGSVTFEFPDLMIEAKQLLGASGSIRTVDELQAMKGKFHVFVRTHYQALSHSDMLRRLIAQYFMMHEYVDYHVSGAPATDIRVQYQQAIMDGVKNWLDILKADIPQHEILNYCVSLYYDRSMVTLAFMIIENFSEVAYCPGEERSTPDFPPELTLTDVDDNRTTLQDLRGSKIFTFVSDDCPVSKVEAVVKARRLARQWNETLIVAPLEPLSENHLAIQKMVSAGNIMFVDDEKWRREYVPKEMKLPRSIRRERKPPVEPTK